MAFPPTKKSEFEDLEKAIDIPEPDLADHGELKVRAGNRSPDPVEKRGGQFFRLPGTLA